MPSFHAPPSLPAVSVDLFRPSIFSANVSKLDQDPVDMDCSSHLALECISDHVHNKPAKSENTSFSLEFGLPSTISHHFSHTNVKLFNNALQTVPLLACWPWFTICLRSETAGWRRDLAAPLLFWHFSMGGDLYKNNIKMVVWTNVSTQTDLDSLEDVAQLVR